MSAQGMAETVAWTTLYDAMVQDGIRPPLQPGTHVASWLREVVVEALFASPAPAAVPVDWDDLIYGVAGGDA